MLIQNVGRLLLSVVFGLTFGVAAWRGLTRKNAEPAVRSVLLALAMCCLTFSVGTLTLFNQPWTVRTWLTALSAVFCLGYVAKFLRHGPPRNPDV